MVEGAYSFFFPKCTLLLYQISYTHSTLESTLLILITQAALLLYVSLTLHLSILQSIYDTVHIIHKQAFQHGSNCFLHWSKTGIDSSKMLITAGPSFIDSQILRPDGTIRSSSLSSSENLLWFFPNNGCPCDAIRTYQHSIPGSVFQLSLCTVQPAYQLHEASFQAPRHTATFLQQSCLHKWSRWVRKEIEGKSAFFRKESPRQSSEKSYVLIATQPKFKVQT